MGSMSRLYSQEKIAAEAYVIASSLERIHIPLEILSYRTIRGFTVIEKLKESVEKNPESVLGYTAGGWNRDSLAIETRYNPELRRHFMPVRLWRNLPETHPQPNRLKRR